MKDLKLFVVKLGKTVVHISLYKILSVSIAVIGFDIKLINDSFNILSVIGFGAKLINDSFTIL